MQFHETSIKLFKLRDFQTVNNGEEKLIIIKRKIDVSVLPKSIFVLCRRAINFHIFQHKSYSKDHKNNLINWSWKKFIGFLRDRANLGQFIYKSPGELHISLHKKLLRLFRGWQRAIDESSFAFMFNLLLFLLHRY